MNAGEVRAGLLDFFDSQSFREKYLNEVVFHNTVNTLLKALGAAAELLHEADVWMTDDGSEPLPIGTGAKIKRFLENLPRPDGKASLVRDASALRNSTEPREEA